MSTSELTFSAVSGNGLILKIDLHNLKKAALVLRAVNLQTQTANPETD